MYVLNQFLNKFQYGNRSTYEAKQEVKKKNVPNRKWTHLMWKELIQVYEQPPFT